MKKLLSGFKAMEVNPDATDPTERKLLGTKVKRKAGFKEVKIEVPLINPQGI